MLANGYFAVVVAFRSGRAFTVAALVCTGCHSLMNGWLDPTVVGNFNRTSITEIRTSLTLEDAPTGIPGATYPAPGDLGVQACEYPVSSGDTLEIEINELRQRQTPYLAQVPVSATGYVNLPIVGRVDAAGKTVIEFEEALRAALRDRAILVEPDVTVNPIFLQKATYSIFGVGVSAANNAPLRAGTFPIRRPDLRVLEAINQVGGLNEFVTEIYIFRDDRGACSSAEPISSSRKYQNSRGVSVTSPSPVPELTKYSGGAPPEPEDKDAAEPSERELMQAVIGEEPPPAGGATRQQIMESLQTDPYIWINEESEWIPNPAYQRPKEVPSISLPLDVTTPAANWSRIAGDSTYRIIQIPAEALRQGDPSWNIYVRAGDVIRIVSGEIGIYYVMGQVNRVGAFAFNAEAVTLKAAIAAAGGLSGLAWPDRCTVYRRLGQREQTIQVNLDRIFAGSDPDFIIKRGDIVNVGTHPFAPFLQRIRALTLPNISSNVGYSFAYARNFADIDSFAVRQNPHNQPSRFPNLFP